MDLPIPRVLLYGIILGILAYILYTRYIKNRKEKKEETPAPPPVTDKEETCKEE